MSATGRADGLPRFRSAVESLSDAVGSLMDGFLEGCPDRDGPIPLAQQDEATDLRSLVHDVETRLERSDRLREAGDLDDELNQLVRCSELLHQLQRGCLDLTIRVRRYVGLRSRSDLGAERWSARVLRELEDVAGAVRAAYESCDECIVALSLGESPPPGRAAATAEPVHRVGRPDPSDKDLTHALDSLAEAVRAVALRLGDVHACLRESRPPAGREEFPVPSKR